MTTSAINQTVKLNRAVKEHLDAADRELAVCNTVKSSGCLWAATRMAAVLTLKQRNLPHDTDAEILASIKAVDAAENADGEILSGYLGVRIFYNNARHDFLNLDEFMFCRPGATEFVDRMQELAEKLEEAV